MSWTLRFTDERQRVAVLVSRETHCLNDLLHRRRSGELPIDIPVVISNHPDHAEMASWFGVEFRHLPIIDGDKAAQEALVGAALAEHDSRPRRARPLHADLVPGILRRVGRPGDQHPPLVPALVQRRTPYHQAHDRGVKLIGVTAHYVTADLDEGPIIDQDVIRVSHRDDVDDLRRKGRDLEVAVLARAVGAHVEHRTLAYGRRTIVFD